MNENKFTRGINPLCPNDKLWSARDEQGCEDEVGEFLYGLVRLIKPAFIVETGCYLGDATIAMARALVKNNHGRLISCDIDLEKVTYTKERIKFEDLREYAEVTLNKGKELIAMIGSQIDFAFIDSSPRGAERKEEIEELLKYLKPGSLFVLHDTAPQHEQICQVANEIELPKIYLNCPRGLTLFQKK